MSPKPTDRNCRPTNLLPAASSQPPTKLVNPSTRQPVMKLGIPVLALVASATGVTAFAPSSSIHPTFGRHGGFGMGVPCGRVQANDIPVRLSSREAGVVALQSSNSMEVWVQCFAGPSNEDLGVNVVQVCGKKRVVDLRNKIPGAFAPHLNGVAVTGLAIYTSTYVNARVLSLGDSVVGQGTSEGTPLYVYAPSWTSSQSTPGQPTVDVASGRFSHSSNLASICLGLVTLALPIFALAHLRGIKEDNSWVDCAKHLKYTGRAAFASTILRSLRIVYNMATAPVATATKTVDDKVAFALVYSSVSGSGKTVSMLQLKNTLPNKIYRRPVTVAYLGFNTQLKLGNEEKRHILFHQEPGAEEVLARRLAASVIISDCNPNTVTSLPMYDNLYKSYGIPPVDESMALLIEHLGAAKDKPAFIVAGVDEVQLLNSASVGGTIELGRFFLRTLREWQCKYFDQGIRLLPLGTGIALDWEVDPTSGTNIPLGGGGDTTLISKKDFRALVNDEVGRLNITQFDGRFSLGTSRETVIDLLSAAYWPRVRLLEWWRDEVSISNRIVHDAKAANWLSWFCNWLRDETLSCTTNRDLVPGDKRGSIRCLFQLDNDAQRFSVIPDGYSSSSLIEVLQNDLPVPNLYKQLDVMRSMEPADFVLQDDTAFENFGFHVMGAAIHVGIHALEGKEITSISATKTQRKRLGLALWFQDKDAVTHRQNRDIIVPTILGPVDATASGFGKYYPFKDSGQSSFVSGVTAILAASSTDRTPVYIRCGKNTCCDYLYFYTRMLTSGSFEFLCDIGDAKHTQTVGADISTADQTKLYNAATNVHASFEAAGLALGDVRLHFVTNKDKLSGQTVGSAKTSFLQAQRKARKLFPNVSLEFLNPHTFEWGPFGDIQAARRK